MPGLGLAASMVKKYRDQRVGMADASNVVLADRYHARTIVKLDRRRFAVLRPIKGGGLPWRRDARRSGIGSNGPST